ncbi:hypothetical protein ACHAWX_001545 [Stephanocyclus meneghinianus]
MRASLSLTTALTFLLANGAISRLHRVACRPAMPIQTPHLRAEICDASREVTGYRELTGCSKAKTFTRNSGSCTGYSKSYALEGYKSAEECANYCMVDAKGIATLIGFNFDCNVCECLQGSGSLKKAANAKSGTMCYKLTSEMSGTSQLKKGQKMSRYC